MIQAPMNPIKGEPVGPPPAENAPGPKTLKYPLNAILLAQLPPIIAAVLQWLFWKQIGPFIWFLFYPAVFLSARISGVIGGILATILSIFLAVFVFVDPQFSIQKESFGFIYSSFLFLGMGTLFGVFQQRLANAKMALLASLETTRIANNELERLYAKAKEMDELKTRFFSNVSHELRTPLTLILGPLGQRLEDPAIDSSLRHDLERMERNALLLMGQVSNLLDVAKVEAGRMDFRPSDTDLAKLIGLECSRFETLAVDRGLEFSLKTPDSIPAQVDEEKFQRILVNLLSNAFKFTPAPGRIAVEVAVDGPNVVLEVMDSGPGIPESQWESVFDRFQQVDGSAERSHGGTGLGLAIAKEFTNLHNGAIAVSKSREGGACFSVRLPLMVQEGVPLVANSPHKEAIVPELIEHPSSIIGLQPSPPNMVARILVVEDNQDMHAFLAETLGRYYKITSAFSGKEGLEKALADPPDLILSDIMMPGMSGDQLISALRNHAEMDHVPIVLLTAKADDALRIRMFHAGVADYICKPFRADELMARIASILSGRQRELTLLKVQQARFQAMFEVSPIPFALNNSEDKITFINPAFTATFGYTAQDIPDLESWWRQAYPDPAYRAWVISAWGERLAHAEREGGAFEPLEVEIHCRDGSLRSVLVASVGLRGVQDTAHLISFYDITERKLAERALRRAMEDLQESQRIAKVGSWHLDIATNQVVWSEELYRMYGFDPTLPPPPYSQHQKLFTPESWERLSAALANTVETGSPYEVELETIREGKSNGWMWAYGKTVFDENGKKIGLVGAAQDITERKHVEQALAKSEKDYRTLIDNLSSGVVVHGVDSSILLSNRMASSLLGLTEDQMLGKTSIDPGWHFLQEDGSVMPLEMYPVNQVLASGEGFNGQVLGICCPDRQDPTWVLCSGYPEKDELGNLIQAVITFSDITERKQLEDEKVKLRAQLQQSQKMESLGTLAGGVAHDMNNVLGAILGLASAHIGKQPYGSPLHQALDTICKATERGGKMVKSLLSFARQSPAENNRLDMNAILREEVALLERTTLAKVRLEIDLDSNLRPILGDASALTHAFMNLFVNAVDAMPENGTLTLHTRNVDKDWIEVVVEDNGTGMPKEVLEKAMEPFYTTKETGKGTGLGLSMVFSTVKAHRGQISIESDQGKGTRVMMRFPSCEQEAPVQAAAPEASEAMQAPHGTLNVLLVDDDDLIQSSVLMILEVLGHTTVTTALSGEEALTMLEAGLEADLVILDMNMPGLGGIGTLPRLRVLRPELPVLLATGRVDQTAMTLASAHPGVTLLSKPFGLRELQKHLENIGLG